MGQKRYNAPDGTIWNEAAWKAAKKRAKACLDPTCAICHTPIDMEAPPYAPLACEVDHIVPTSRGGAFYDLDNLQLTHSRCNRKKGNRMQSDYPNKEMAENPVPLSNNW